MNVVAAKHPPHDLNWGEKIPALVLLAALFFVGFWPKSMSDPINAALAGMKFSDRTLSTKVATSNALPR
jgi:NADH-quinone oxidoreductase subunit M